MILTQSKGPQAVSEDNLQLLENAAVLSADSYFGGHLKALSQTVTFQVSPNGQLEIPREQTVCLVKDYVTGRISITPDGWKSMNNDSQRQLARDLSKYNQDHASNAMQPEVLPLTREEIRANQDIDGEYYGYPSDDESIFVNVMKGRKDGIFVTTAGLKSRDLFQSQIAHPEEAIAYRIEIGKDRGAGGYIIYSQDRNTIREIHNLAVEIYREDSPKAARAAVQRQLIERDLPWEWQD